MHAFDPLAAVRVHAGHSRPHVGRHHHRTPSSVTLTSSLAPDPEAIHGSRGARPVGRSQQSHQDKGGPSSRLALACSRFYLAWVYSAFCARADRLISPARYRLTYRCWQVRTVLSSAQSHGYQSGQGGALVTNERSRFYLARMYTTRLLRVRVDSGRQAY